MALLGGRVAEEIRFGDVTTGASNDLERVTQMARAMVTQWGMSEKLGPIRYGEREELMFLNRSFAEHRNYSDKVAQEIDEEIHRIVEDAHQRCHTALNEHWPAMVQVANRLLEVETINATEFRGPHARRRAGGHAQRSAPGSRYRRAQVHERKARCATTNALTVASTSPGVCLNQPDMAG